MESPVKIILDADNITNRYYAGHMIYGKVCCTFTKDEIVNSIQINYKGFARTKWVANTDNVQKTFWAEEVYFDRTQELIENNAEPEICISAGLCSYPFSFKLPRGIPSSFHDNYGKVEYIIKASIIRPSQPNYENEHTVFVTSPLDLNNLPVREPFSKSLEETFSCCCYKSGEVSLTVSLPFTGYAADQEIEVATHVNNKANFNITSVCYDIIRTNEYSAHNPWKNKRYSKHHLGSYTESVSVTAHTEKSWSSCMKVNIEDVINLLSCGIINASHYLEVKLILPFPYTHLKVTCPITLGTNPLKGNSSPTNLNSTIFTVPSIRITSLEDDDTDIPKSLNNNLKSCNTKAKELDDVCITSFIATSVCLTRLIRQLNRSKTEEYNKKT